MYISQINIVTSLKDREIFVVFYIVNIVHSIYTYMHIYIYIYTYMYMYVRARIYTLYTYIQILPIIFILNIQLMCARACVRVLENLVETINCFIIYIIDAYYIDNYFTINTCYN